MNRYFEFRSTLGRVRDAAAILANRHGWDSRATIIGTRHLMIVWHWHPSGRGELEGDAHRTHIAVDGTTHPGPAHPCPPCDRLEVS